VLCAKFAAWLRDIPFSIPLRAVDPLFTASASYCRPRSRMLAAPMCCFTPPRGLPSPMSGPVDLINNLPVPSGAMIRAGKGPTRNPPRPCKQSSWDCIEDIRVSICLTSSSTQVETPGRSCRSLKSPASYLEPALRTLVPAKVIEAVHSPNGFGGERLCPATAALIWTFQDSVQ